MALAVDPLKFVREVRAEVAKVTWPSRKETLVTTGLVFALSAMAAAFFYLFSALAVGSAFMVIASRNPVHSVLYLILAFVNAAGLFILLNLLADVLYAVINPRLRTA